MAMFTFDASSVAPQESAAPIPAGLYNAQVIESSIAPIKSGNGSAVKLTFQIISGEHRGRRVWSHLNVRHTNQDAQRIAQSQLSSLCRAAGVMRLQDTTELHGKPVAIKVKVRKSDDYGDSNEIAAFDRVQGPGPATAPPAMPHAQQGFPPPAAATAPAPPAAFSPPAAMAQAMPPTAPWATASA